MVKCPQKMEMSKKRVRLIEFKCDFCTEFFYGKMEMSNIWNRQTTHTHTTSRWIISLRFVNDRSLVCVVGVIKYVSFSIVHNAQRLRKHLKQLIVQSVRYLNELPSTKLFGRVLSNCGNEKSFDCRTSIKCWKNNIFLCLNWI